MNKKKIENILDDLEKNILNLRVELGSIPNSKEEPLAGKKKLNTSKKERSIDLNGPIKSLYDAGFFKEGKIDLEVIKELQMKLLTSKKPLRSSVVNVLRKLVSDKLLIRDYITKDKKSILVYKNAI